MDLVQAALAPLFKEPDRQNFSLIRQERMEDERREEEAAAKLKERMEDRRRDKERSAILKKLKEGWDVEDQVFQVDRAMQTERDRKRQKELRKMKERWEEEDKERETEREADESRRAWKWEMKNPGEFSGGSEQH